MKPAPDCRGLLSDQFEGCPMPICFKCTRWAKQSAIAVPPLSPDVRAKVYKPTGTVYLTCRDRITHKE